VLGQNGFIENKGQMPEFIKYNKKINNGMLYYSSQGYHVLIKNAEDLDSMWHEIHLKKKLEKDYVVRYHRFDVNFLNANIVQPIAVQKYLRKYNFYIGNNPNHWGLDASSFHSILYRNIYNGIDCEYITHGYGIKNNFIVNPLSNPNNIQLNYSHTEGVAIVDGRLHIQTSVGTLIEDKPIAFQIINNDTIYIDCKFKITQAENTYIIGFDIGTYDHSTQLIIDPILVFSTYSGSQGDNFGFTATYDSKSNLYAGGIVDGGTGTESGPFPVTTGAFQTVYSGGIGQNPAGLPCDIGINKYDSAGNNLLYSTYVGGSRDEYPHSLVVDKYDNLLIMGTAYSPDFPMDTTGFQKQFKGNTDIFVIKLNEDGSDLLGGTFMGGADFDGLNSRTLRYNYSDDYRGDVVVDSMNNVYVASTTNSFDFPTKNAIQNTRASLQDGCLFSLDSNLRNLRFSTFLGGNSDDAMYSVRLYDSFVYVGGGTASNAMAFAVNGHKNAYTGGRADGFVAKMKLDGSLINATYFGTAAYDQIYFLDIDASGNVYAAGQTEGSLTRTPGTYGKDNTSQFIIRYSPNLAVINLTTTFGNRTFNPEIAPSAFLVDRCNNIYFSGWGSPITDGILHPLTTRDLYVSSDAIQKTTDNADFYLLVLNKNANNILYATYFGGDKTEDHVDGGTSRFDKKGVVYQSVCSSCPGFNQHFDDFPVSANAPFKLNLSPRCSNASFKLDFQINFEVDAKFTANPTKGCSPLTVNFINQSKIARTYFWDFGDGTQDTAKNPVHTFTEKGKYMVKLTSIDSFSCNISETDSIEIEVLETPEAKFELRGEECKREIEFTNQSTNYVNPEWDFGDTSAIVKEENPKYTYYKNGNYKVLLTVSHPISGCKDTQSAYVSMFDDPLHSIKIPNVYTPNGDSFNDCYQVGGISDNCDEVEIWIYNRWGILVFNGYLPADCWNGKYMKDGKDLPTGTYYYILKIRSNNPANKDETKFEGVIHLIR
jgi:gliding motility-associated-like protein